MYKLIIDFHVHIFPDNIANRAVGKLADISGLTPFTDGTLKDTMSKAKDCNIDLCVLLNIATKPSQQKSINDEASRISSQYEMFTSFGSVHPDAEDCLDELYRIKDLGIKGIKLHPDYQGFFAFDNKVLPIYDLCGKLSLPVVLHAGWDCYSPDVMHAKPEDLSKVAKAYPHTKFVLRIWEV